ncbi:MAG: molecular chaperone HtpG [Gallicola sp.]|nr:molecular chaperone HtpG [Gallicola sp.]
MTQREFKTESKKLMDLMINSIYTNKEIFLRELISNASDAIDKLYYKTLSDDNLEFNKEDYFIEIKIDKENRTLTISDTGIGMDEKDLEENLGTIAKSGTQEFKEELKASDEVSEIIGQFGVGFYASFMTAKKVTVLTKKFGSNKAYKWESEGVEGYRITEASKETAGTDIILELKNNTEEENYDEYLEEYTLRNLVERYSNYIRYPIKMLATKSRNTAQEGEEPKYEEYQELEVLNSMTPIWKKNKSDLTEEDYNNFYLDQHYGFDKPLTHLHISAEGTVSYRAILYIPRQTPFDYYSKDYEKGLQLYSNGVLIMDKCEALLPDYYSFVKGVVDSEDLSLNISRETLQHNRQLLTIAKNIENKITQELKKMQKDRPEDYEAFYSAFGNQIKLGIYESYGMKKDPLQDLLVFYSSQKEKSITLKEYADNMKEDQKYIYYATGSSIEQIEKLPQGSALKEKDMEILYLTESIDEFVLKVLQKYDEKEFKSISSEDLGLKEETKEEEKNEVLFESMKDILGEEVVEVRTSQRLEEDPVCLVSRGDISIEMEKAFLNQPNSMGMTAQKVLEINPNHPIYKKLKESQSENKEEELKLYTELLYNQARLIEGLPIEDPVAYTNSIWKLIK